MTIELNLYTVEYLDVKDNSHPVLIQSFAARSLREVLEIAMENPPDESARMHIRPEGTVVLKSQ